MRVAVAGVGGRMGRAVIHAAAARDDVAVTGGWVRPGSNAEGEDLGLLAGRPASGVIATGDLATALESAEVLIDFTLPAALTTVLEACRDCRLPLVTGTTGLGEAQKAAVAAASGTIPIVQAANMSVGVAVLIDLAERAGAALGSDYDAEIIEIHHRHKLDAPSGTALAIGEAVSRARGAEAPVEAGRGPGSGRRTAGAIGYASVRAGEVVGEHTLLLAGRGERLELTHRAADRAAFADGALRAAEWLRGRPPGLYGMRDVLGLI